jgi:protein-S-isoprenylcysteine O-methyltransferase Ste14
MGSRRRHRRKSKDAGDASLDTYPQVTTGPYRVVRHPIYTAYLCLFAGGLGALGSPLAIAVLLLSAWRFYKPRMASEDKILEEQFGDAWRNYAAKTPSRLLPFVV